MNSIFGKRFLCKILTKYDNIINNFSFTKRISEYIFEISKKDNT